MARTVDPVAHAGRRESFLDAATRLIQLKGYDQLSLQDVITEASASKGAFYHYFDSKTALLEGVVMRMVEAGTQSLVANVAAPGPSALDKLEGVFSGLADFKAERKDLILASMRSWMSEENTVVRGRFRRLSLARITPLFTVIIEQGVAEGSFTATAPAPTARVFAALVMDANEAASELFVSWSRGEVTFDEVVRAMAAFGEAFERVLGTTPGALGFERRTSVLREWFDAAAGTAPHPGTDTASGTGAGPGTDPDTGTDTGTGTGTGTGRAMTSGSGGTT